MQFRFWGIYKDLQCSPKQNYSLLTETSVHLEGCNSVLNCPEIDPSLTNS